MVYAILVIDGTLRTTTSMWVPFALFSAGAIASRRTWSNNESQPAFKKYAVLSAVLGLLIVAQWQFVEHLWPLAALTSIWYVVWIPVSFKALNAASDRLVLLLTAFIVLNVAAFFFAQLSDPGEPAPMLALTRMLTLLLLIVGGIVFTKAYEYEKKFLREWDDYLRNMSAATTN